MHRSSVLALAVCLAAWLPARAQDHAIPRPANVSAGEDVFIKCSGCHQLGPDAENSIGPVLNGVVGRPAASVDGYDYSAALRDSKLRWTPDNIAAFVQDPRKLVPGTKMSFAGLKNRQDVDDLIAYLAQFDHEGRTR